MARSRSGRLDESRRFATRAGAESVRWRELVEASRTCRGDAGGVRGVAEDAGIGIDIHAAADGADEVDGDGSWGSGTWRLADAAARRRMMLKAFSLVRRVRLVRRRRNAARTTLVQHEQAVGRTPLAGLGERVALGPRMFDMFTSQGRFSDSAGTEARTTTGRCPGSGRCRSRRRAFGGAGSSASSRSLADIILTTLLLRPWSAPRSDPGSSAWRRGTCAMSAWPEALFATGA